MKSYRVIVYAVIVPFLVLMTGGCGPGKYTPKSNEELYGTWINPSYSGEFSSGVIYPQKETIDSNGYQIYRLVDDHAKYWVGKEQIVAKWIDKEGNAWYKTDRFSNNGQKAIVLKCLYKISKSSTVRESTWKEGDTPSSVSFPVGIDSKDSTYRFYERKGD